MNDSKKNDDFVLVSRMGKNEFLLVMEDGEITIFERPSFNLRTQTIGIPLSDLNMDIIDEFIRFIALNFVTTFLRNHKI